MSRCTSRRISVSMSASVRARTNTGSSECPSLSSSSSSSTRSFDFLALPCEIRHLVFQHLFDGVVIRPWLRGCVDVVGYTGTPASTSTSETEAATTTTTTTDVFLVSKLFYREARLMFFRWALFDFSERLKGNRNGFGKMITSGGGRGGGVESERVEKREVESSRVYMPAECLERAERIYGGEELLHCLGVSKKEGLRDEMGTNVFPGLVCERLRVRELLVEFWVHEVQVRNPELLTSWSRNGLAKLHQLRSMQSQSLPYKLNLRIVYWSDGNRLPPNEHKKYNYGDKSEWPMFDIDPQGCITRLNGEPNANGIALLEDLIKIYKLNADTVRAEIERMRERIQILAWGRMAELAWFQTEQGAHSQARQQALGHASTQAVERAVVSAS